MVPLVLLITLPLSPISIPTIPPPDILIAPLLSTLLPALIPVEFSPATVTVPRLLTCPEVEEIPVPESFNSIEALRLL